MSDNHHLMIKKKDITYQISAGFYSL
ncbi:uncharacterized protein METZ01_LOCUS377414 [marine metagenome]|uniref:Uncharacterized protein n=1 Tax=marine metagenome TaxID=408172 RepID=A0A382TR83_9ZZZZ